VRSWKPCQSSSKDSV